ncbi:MAG: AI-2E family transporter [Rubripirellula sp.]
MNKPITLNRASNTQVFVIAMMLMTLILATAGLFVPTLSIVLLVFAGLLFGVFVQAISEWPSRHSPLSYRTSFLAVVTVMLLSISIGFFYLGSQAVRRADELWTQLQSAVRTADERLSQNDWTSEHLPSVSEMQDKVTQSTSSILPEMFQGLQWFGWGATGTMVIFFVGLYAAYEPDLYRAGLIKLVPVDRRDRAKSVLKQLKSALRLWIVGRLLSMALVGIATAIAMGILGIPLPVSLGVLAALFTFIPNIGPLLAAVPQMLLAVNVGTQTVLYVLLFNVILQTVESYLITPLVQRHELSLPPILTIAAQLVMGVLVGIVGIMMAAPLVVVAMVLVQMLYVQDCLGDEQTSQLTSDSS